MGKLSVILDSAGRQRAVIRTTRVEHCRFDEVGADFARLEGEGDGSLGYWQRVHREYFERWLARRGGSFADSMVLTLETFALVHPLPSP